MNINAIPISKLFKDNEDLYEKVVIGARRQRQIIESRVSKYDAFEEIEDTEQLEEFDDLDHDIDKPMAVAMEELLEDELDWRYNTEEEE
tara:strand:+ start:165 stop:431 length:267 start_codon:yes stop_codon:yes gene_type:complete